MHEATLRDFFVGDCDSDDLAEDLEGSVRTEGITSHHDIVDMDHRFMIRPSHLIRICDAVIEGKLNPQRLQQIGFCILASDNFELAGTPSDDRLAHTLHQWAAPEINYALTVDNTRKWKTLLEVGENTFD